MRIAITIAALSIVAFATGPVWFDEGEVATLVITDADGRQRTVDLWIVDLEGRTWVRASRPDARWLEALRSNPAVGLFRDGGTSEVRAVVAPEAQQRVAVNRAMASKYGIADRMLDWLRDSQRSVPVRLDSRLSAGR